MGMGLGQENIMRMGLGQGNIMGIGLGQGNIMGMGLGQGSIMGMGLGQGNIVERYSFMHSEKSSLGSLLCCLGLTLSTRSANILAHGLYTRVARCANILARELSRM